MTHHHLRGLALGLLLLVLTLGALTARAVFEGQEAMALSNAAFNRGDVRASADHARRAAVLYAPGAPHVLLAYERLRAIAVGSEATGDALMARAAWRALRGTILETRHVWTPFPDLLAEANRELARLDVLDLPPTLDRDAARRRSLALLGRVDAPRAPWILVLILGVALCIAGLFGVAVRGYEGRGSFQLRQVRFLACILFVGVVCWTVAAYQA